MTQELMECTIRDWVLSNPKRGARDLRRIMPSSQVAGERSPEEVADALIAAAKRHVAATRLW